MSDKKEKEETIILHTDSILTKEAAEAINEAVKQAGPIQMAGMGLAVSMEKTANALKNGLEKIEQAEKEFEEKVDPEILSVAKEDPGENVLAIKAERDRLKEELERANKVIDTLTDEKK